MGKPSFAVVEESNPWLIAHEALSRLARERAAADAEEGRWLLAALRAATHVHLGFGSFAEYIERSFGYKPRSTQEKLRVAAALEELPVLSRALSEARLHWSGVRELTRVAVAATEREWLELARGKTLRQVEELVAGRRLGDEPSAPRNPSAQRRVLRFEVAPETFALFREARSELRRRSDAALDDDAVLLEMSQLVLRGPRDEGRSSYQISLHVCAECGNGQQAANGELVSVGPEVVAMARCDGQNIGHVPLEPTSPLVGQTVPANETTRVPESAPVGAKPRARADTATTQRAQQSIPPAVRRAVLARDQRRCRVPGCRNATFLHVHHLELRSEGGLHAAENLLTVCGLHHRALHRGELIVEGSSPSALFRHADGSDYGHPLQPRALDTAVQVFGGLRNLGFREREIRQVLGELRQDQRLRGASAEALLREALARLRPPRPPFR